MTNLNELESLLAAARPGLPWKDCGPTMAHLHMVDGEDGTVAHGVWLHNAALMVWLANHADELLKGARRERAMRTNLIDAARTIMVALYTEDGEPDGSEEGLLDRIAMNLGLTRGQLEEETGPWTYEDEKCPTCGGLGGGMGSAVPPVCPDCDGIGRLTVKKRTVQP